MTRHLLGEVVQPEERAHQGRGGVRRLDLVRQFAVGTRLGQKARDGSRPDGEGRGYGDVDGAALSPQTRAGCGS